MILQSLVPPQYLVDDKDMVFHLRCVFLGGIASRSCGAYGLCLAARDVLIARGYLSAVIAWSAGDTGLLVFDDAETTELLARRSPHLLYHFGLQMHESSLFRLPASAVPADGEASLLLPPYIHLGRTEYRYRVLLLTGLDTEHCDAAEVAYYIQQRLDLNYEQHEIEAVIVHRSQHLVLLVLQSSEDAEMLLQDPPETWLQAFGGQQPALVSIFKWPVTWPRLLQHYSSDPELQPMPRRDWRGTIAFERLRYMITEQVRERRDGETIRIVRDLIGLCALSDPEVVLRGRFWERSLLLSGIAPHTGWPDLCSRLSAFGVLDDVVFDELRGLALAVFRSSFGAASLRQEPADTWMLLGFQDCQRAPGAEHAHCFALRVVDLLHQLDPSPVSSCT